MLLVCTQLDQQYEDCEPRDVFHPPSCSQRSVSAADVEYDLSELSPATCGNGDESCLQEPIECYSSSTTSSKDELGLNLLENEACLTLKDDSDGLVALQLNTLEHIVPDERLLTDWPLKVTTSLCSCSSSERSNPDSGLTNMQEAVKLTIETKLFSNDFCAPKAMESTSPTDSQRENYKYTLSTLSSEIGNVDCSLTSQLLASSKRDITKKHVSFNLPSAATVHDSTPVCQIREASPSWSLETSGTTDEVIRLMSMKQVVEEMHTFNGCTLEPAVCSCTAGHDLIALEKNVTRSRVSFDYPLEAIGLEGSVDCEAESHQRSSLKSTKGAEYEVTINRGNVMQQMDQVSPPSSSDKQANCQMSNRKLCDECEDYTEQNATPTEQSRLKVVNAERAVRSEFSTKSLLLSSEKTSDSENILLESPRHDLDKCDRLDYKFQTKTSATLPTLLSRSKEDGLLGSSMLMQPFSDQRGSQEIMETELPIPIASTLLKQLEGVSEECSGVGLPTVEVSYFRHLLNSGKAPPVLKRLKQRFHLNIFDDEIPSSCNMCYRNCSKHGHLLSKFNEQVENLSANNNVVDKETVSQQQPRLEAAVAVPTSTENKNSELKDSDCFTHHGPEMDTQIVEKSEGASRYEQKVLNNPPNSNVSAEFELVETNMPNTMELIDEYHLNIASSANTGESGRSKPNDSEITLQSKPGLHSVGLVLYYPVEHKDDEIDGNCAGRLAISEEPLQKVAAGSSSEDVVAVKEAVSSPNDGATVRTATTDLQRKPSVLKRIKAFFGRSNNYSGSTSTPYFTVALSNDRESSNVVPTSESLTCAPLTSTKSAEANNEATRGVNSAIDEGSETADPTASCRTSPSLAIMKLRKNKQKPAADRPEGLESDESCVHIASLQAEETQSAPTIHPCNSGSEPGEYTSGKGEMAVTSSGDPKLFASWDHGKEDAVFIQMSKKDSSDRSISKVARKYVVLESQPPKGSCENTSLKRTAGETKSANATAGLLYAVSSDANSENEQLPTQRTEIDATDSHVKR